MLQVSVAIVPLAQRVFQMPLHTWSEWLMIAALGLMPVTLIEVIKLLQGFRQTATSD